MKKLVLFALTLSISLALKAQNDVKIGNSFQLNLQRQNSHADAWILHNALYSSLDDKLKWESTHASFGSRGIRFSYSGGKGIYFYADEKATSAGTEFTPTTRFFIGNNGNIGVGTITPDSRFNVFQSSNEDWAAKIYNGGGSGKGLLIQAGWYGNSTNPILQLEDGNNHVRFFAASNGNIGIGTATPDSKLQVIQSSNEDWAAKIYNGGGSGKGLLIQAGYYGNSTNPILQLEDGDNHVRFFAASNGNVGIGTSNPETKLHVKDGVVKAGTYDATNGTLQFAGNYSGNNILNTYGSQYSTGATSIGFGVKPNSGSQGFVSSAENSSFGRGLLLIDNHLEFLNAGASQTGIGTGIDMTSRFFIRADGNVGIGTNTPQYKLAVKGNIGCGEIKVEDVATWPDFVFSPTYSLITLEDLEQYIKTNNHLPDVPSEKEVKENGLSLGQSDAVLLQKIEELTLYLIEQNKKTKEQSEKTKNQEEKIKEQSEKIKVLEGAKVKAEVEIEALKKQNELLKTQQTAIEELRKELQELKSNKNNF